MAGASLRSSELRVCAVTGLLRRRNALLFDHRVG